MTRKIDRRVARLEARRRPVPGVMLIIPRKVTEDEWDAGAIPDMDAPRVVSAGGQSFARPPGEDVSAFMARIAARSLARAWVVEE